MDFPPTEHHPFQLGHIVRLKSGGPQMTVAGRGAGTGPGNQPLDLVTCAWTTVDDVLQVGTFPVQCVALVT